MPKYIFATLWKWVDVPEVFRLMGLSIPENAKPDWEVTGMKHKLQKVSKISNRILINHCLWTLLPEVDPSNPKFTILSFKETRYRMYTADLKRLEE